MIEKFAKAPPDRTFYKAQELRRLAGIKQVLEDLVEGLGLLRGTGIWPGCGKPTGCQARRVYVRACLLCVSDFPIIFQFIFVLTIAQLVTV